MRHVPVSLPSMPRIVQRRYVVRCTPHAQILWLPRTQIRERTDRCGVTVQHMTSDSLLVRNASSVLTLSSAGGPKRGDALKDLGERPSAAVAIRDGVILAVGPVSELEALLARDDPQVIDAEGGLVIPGFVDPHTH